MNRKQKVAVVVGALVIALLALFPTWELTYEFGDAPPGWTGHYGPRWIGSPPANPNEPSERRRRSLHSKIRDLSPEVYDSMRDELPVLSAVSIRWMPLIAHVTATIALTVAAVVVLKERKPE